MPKSSELKISKSYSRTAGNLSLVAGTPTCNAHCPFCVSGMTPAVSPSKKIAPVNLANFNTAVGMAVNRSASTALITGKGEPTLFNGDHIYQYLKALPCPSTGAVPMRELQTNGLLFMHPHHREDYSEHLRAWRELNLNTIAISLVSRHEEENQPIYTPKGDHYDVTEQIAHLKSFGYTVRLSMVMLAGILDTCDAVDDLISWASDAGVDQLTMRPVAKPDSSENQSMVDWVTHRMVPDESMRKIEDHLIEKGSVLETLPHGAVILDINGQNVCLTNCLTIDRSGESLRQLIYFPDGSFRYDWQHAGAVLLGPSSNVEVPKELVQLG